MCNNNSYDSEVRHKESKHRAINNCGMTHVDGSYQKMTAFDLNDALADVNYFLLIFKKKKKDRIMRQKCCKSIGEISIRI